MTPKGAYLKEGRTPTKVVRDALFVRAIFLKLGLTWEPAVHKRVKIQPDINTGASRRARRFLLQGCLEQLLRVLV